MMIDLSTIDRYELDRRIVRQGGLAEFVRMAWHIVEPAVKIKWNWHIHTVCDHFEAVSRGEIRLLVVNIPPGCMKTLLVTFWHLWEWTIRPETAFMAASFDLSLMLKQSNQILKVLASDWFRLRWGDKASFSKSEREEFGELKQVILDVALTRAASEFYLTHGGYRFSTSVGGKGTGRHVDIQIVDDPIKPKDAKSAELSEKLIEVDTWWGQTMASRHRDPKTFRRVIIMQRLHQSDLAGKAIDSGEYTVLRLPMEFEARNRCETEWGVDPRTEEGELLWEDRFDAKWTALQKTSAGMGPTDYATQCQQRPDIEGGGTFKTKYVQHYTAQQIPARFEHYIQTWDFTFKDLKSSDFVAGLVMGMTGADIYITDGHNEQLSFTDSCSVLKAWDKKHQKARVKLVEDKANGTAIVDHLRRIVPGLMLREPEGGKIARANASQPYWESYNIWLPELTEANKKWLLPLIEQLRFFPRGSYDDLVDAFTQGVIYLDSKRTDSYADAIAKMKGRT